MTNGRPPGYPKSGGRAKGTPNKATKAIEDKLAALGCDPIEGLARIAIDESNDVKIRLTAFSELAQYVAAKRKAVEHSGEIGGNTGGVLLVPAGQTLEEWMQRGAVHDEKPKPA